MSSVISFAQGSLTSPSPLTARILILALFQTDDKLDETNLQTSLIEELAFENESMFFECAGNVHERQFWLAHDLQKIS